jgi:hypothetical protein
MKVLWLVETSGTTDPTTQRHIPEDLSLQQRHCDVRPPNLKVTRGEPIILAVQSTIATGTVTSLCIPQVGLIYLKIVRPKQRTRTLQFSNKAVVCRRDGRLCFMFRVGDLRRSHIIEAKMRVLLIEARTTREGEVVSPSRTELKVLPS